MRDVFVFNTVICISPLKLLSLFSKLHWPLLQLDIFQIPLKVSFISMSVESDICFRSPMVGSPPLPLKGIGLSGELADLAKFASSFPWGSCLIWGHCKTPWGCCFAAFKNKSLYDPELLCTKL